MDRIGLGSEVLPALRDLRGFRHVMIHAYDLDLDRERLALVLRHAQVLSQALPDTTTRFFKAIQDQEYPETSGHGD